MSVANLFALKHRPGDMVYIRDDVFSWIPAKILSYNRKEQSANVEIVLPPSWKTTIENSEVVYSLYPIDSRTGKRKKKIDLSKYEGNLLPYQNLDGEKKLLCQDDLADLPHLHDAAILYNLKERSQRGAPYTRVGEIIVAVNPNTWIEGYYTNEKRDMYSDRIIWNPRSESKPRRLDDEFETDLEMMYPPHVYETSSLALSGMLHDNQDQAVLVSGESGAGKTETLKIILEHLAKSQNSRPNSKKEDMSAKAILTMEKVLNSDPIFEAFGNAKTIRNYNSSRFGRFTELEFEVYKKSSKNDVPLFFLIGSKTQTYLLEKSRVVSHDEGERSFHIFYQMLAAPDNAKSEIWQHLIGARISHFRYLDCIPHLHNLDTSTDAQKWDITVKTLNDFGIKDESYRNLMKAMCAILQIGNIAIAEDPYDNSGEVVSLIDSPIEMKKLCDLLGLDIKKLTKSITNRTISARRERIVIKLSPQEAKESCDSLAKAMYLGIHEFLINEVNQATRGYSLESESSTIRFISLLDIFGFENFEVNRFEQLCINFANEALQNKYVTDKFTSIREEYSSEGISVFDVALVDNSDVLDLLSNRYGLLAALNEECSRKSGSDTSFVFKIKKMHSDSPALVSSPLDTPLEFSIKHYAETVTYNAANFVKKNTDALPLDLIKCVSSCSNPILSHSFNILLSNIEQRESSGSMRFSRSKNTVTTKFQVQLLELMKSIKYVRSRFIRCIKPNAQQVPKVMDLHMTMRQLESSGLVAAVEITKASYPDNMTYERMIDRFEFLLPSAKLIGKNPKEQVAIILQDQLGHLKIKGKHDEVQMLYAMGNTKAFFRAGALERLEHERETYYDKHATTIQRWMRAKYLRNFFIKQRAAAIRIQSWYRASKYRHEFVSRKVTAVLLQNMVRARIARARVRSVKESQAALIIQKRYRVVKSKEEKDRLKKASEVILRAVNANINNRKLKIHLSDIVEQVQSENSYNDWDKEVTKCLDLEDFSNSKKLLEEAQRYLRKFFDELVQLRKAKAEQEAKIRKLQTVKQQISFERQTSGALVAATKTQLRSVNKLNDELAATVETKRNQIKYVKMKSELLMSELSLRIEEISLDTDKRLAAKDAEIARLKKEIETMKFRHGKELQHLNEKMREEQRKHLEVETHLMDSLKYNEQAHDNYLKKLWKLLDEADAARDAKMEDMKQSYEMKLKSQDEENDKLRRQISSGSLKKRRNIFRRRQNNT